MRRRRAQIAVDGRARWRRLQGRAEKGRRDLHADLEAIREQPELVMPRDGGADLGRLLCHPELGGVLRWLIRLRAARAWRPDGVVDVFPYQCDIRANTRRRAAAVSYLEGCTAPQRDRNQLHAAVVELVAADDAEDPEYSTVQNWYPGDKASAWDLQLRHQARRLPRHQFKISWTQVETGSAITWNCPRGILRGDNSRGEFYSIAISNGRPQVDSGTR